MTAPERDVPATVGEASQLDQLRFLHEVAHAQTILAYGLNGRDLPQGNGWPLRLRVERQCGYKNLKFLRSIQVVDSMASFGKGTGGTNSDFGFHWFAGV